MRDFHKPTVKVTSSGVGFPGLLALLFIGLRLSDVIDWPWIWVLAPLWIAPLLGLFLFVVVGFAVLIAASRPSKPGQLSKNI